MLCYGPRAVTDIVHEVPERYKRGKYNHLPQGLIPKALSLFTEIKDQSRRTAILLFRTIIITNNQSRCLKIKIYPIK